MKYVSNYNEIQHRNYSFNNEFGNSYKVDGKQNGMRKLEDNTKSNQIKSNQIQLSDPTTYKPTYTNSTTAATYWHNIYPPICMYLSNSPPVYLNTYLLLERDATLQYYVLTPWPVTLCSISCLQGLRTLSTEYLPII
jgi:hypothetical protein